MHGGLSLCLGILPAGQPDKILNSGELYLLFQPGKVDVVVMMVGRFNGDDVWIVQCRALGQKAAGGVGLYKAFYGKELGCMLNGVSERKAAALQLPLNAFS